MDTYTSKQARDMLHVDVKTFLRWLDKAGIHPQVSKADNRVKLFTLEQLEHLAAEHARTLDMQATEEVPQVTFADLVEQVIGLTGQVLNVQSKMDALERRVAAQDEKMVRLESQPDGFPISQYQPISRPSERQRWVSAKREPLPEGLVSWYGFAELHHIPKSTIRKAIDYGRLPVMQGSWQEGKAHIKEALDAASRAQFFELYHENSHFKPCEQCPHSVD